MFLAGCKRAHWMECMIVVSLLDLDSNGFLQFVEYIFSVQEILTCVIQGRYSSHGFQLSISLRPQSNKPRDWLTTTVLHIFQLQVARLSPTHFFDQALVQTCCFWSIAGGQMLSWANNDTISLLVIVCASYNAKQNRLVAAAKLNKKDFLYIWISVYFRK